MKKINAINLNNYVRPDEKLNLIGTNKYLTHGIDNSYFYYVEERYIGSATNNAVIDAYCNYIYGEGLTSNDVDINTIIKKNDVRLAIKDLKTHGQFSLQVVYTKDRKSIARLYHIPVKCVAIDRQPDITDDVENYWYCFDWRYKTKYKPQRIPAFNTTNGQETEISFTRIPSSEPIFSLPDYQSALQYCDLEEELSNFYNKHVKNNFSVGTIININQGFDSPEEQEEAERSIISKTTGSDNAGGVIISVNDNKENATTVERIDIVDAYQRFEWLSTEARDKILLAHKVVNPILFGVKDSSGLGNNALEMESSLKTLYRSQIKPTREIFIDALEDILKFGGKTIELEFKDFEELRVQPVQPETSLSIEDEELKKKVEMASKKVSFDYDETLSTARGKERLYKHYSDGDTIYVISARDNQSNLEDLVKNIEGVNLLRVYATGSNKNKIEKVKELNIDIHYDNNRNVINELLGIGKLVEFNSIEENMAIYKSGVISSNVRSYKYNDNGRVDGGTLELYFHDGSGYRYSNISVEDFQHIVNGDAICSTSGSNENGLWFIGKTPSVGAAVWKYLIDRNKKYTKI